MGVQSHCTQDLGGGYSLTVLILADMASDSMVPMVSFYLGQIQDWGWGYSLTVLWIGGGVQSYCTHTG